MSRSRWTQHAACWAVLALFALFIGCDAEEVAATQLLVHVDSDLEVDTQLTKVEIEVRSVDGRRADQHLFALTTGTPHNRDEVSLPFSFGVEKHTANELQVVVTGLGPSSSGSDQPVIERKLSAVFKSQHTLHANVFLSQVCFKHVCESDDETCALEDDGDSKAGACTAIAPAALTNAPTELTPPDSSEDQAGSRASGEAGKPAADGGGGGRSNAAGSGGAGGNRVVPRGGTGGSGAGGRSGSGGVGGGATAGSSGDSGDDEFGGSGGGSSPICVPSCTGRECGPDSCGGFCGLGCALGALCVSGECQVACGTQTPCSCGPAPVSSWGETISDSACAGGVDQVLPCTNPAVYCPTSPVTYAWFAVCTCP